MVKILSLTFRADAPEVCDLHQHFGEHVWFMRPPLSHVDLQRFEQRLLQDVDFVRLLQVLTICTQTGHLTLTRFLGKRSDFLPMHYA